MENREIKNKIKNIGNKEAVLFLSDAHGAPLIVFHNHTRDLQPVQSALQQLPWLDFNLLCIGNLLWHHDMTPWHCPPLSPRDVPCTGGADAYLALLLSDILPWTKEQIHGTPAFTGIAGYSLAGLFALYALYRCDAFDRAASISGSLWFPDFKEYCLAHPMKKAPEKIYLSLGDKEAKTRNPVLRTVRENTQAIAAHYRSLGLDTTFEWNPGNHFRDAGTRCAKGIRGILG